jgi:hypothetical protein
MSGHRRGGDDRDAGDDVKASLDSEREKDAAVPRVRENVRFSEVYDRAVLVAENG